MPSKEVVEDEDASAELEVVLELLAVAEEPQAARPRAPVIPRAAVMNWRRLSVALDMVAPICGKDVQNYARRFSAVEYRCTE